MVDYHLYRGILGEQEASGTKRRAGLTARERRNTPLESYESGILRTKDDSLLVYGDNPYYTTLADLFAHVGRMDEDGLIRWNEERYPGLAPEQAVVQTARGESAADRVADVLVGVEGIPKRRRLGRDGGGIDTVSASGAAGRTGADDSETADRTSGSLVKMGRWVGLSERGGALYQGSGREKGRLVQSRNTEATAREYQDSHRRSNGRLRRGRLEQNKTDYATQNSEAPNGASAVSTNGANRRRAGENLKKACEQIQCKHRKRSHQIPCKLRYTLGETCLQSIPIRYPPNSSGIRRNKLSKSENERITGFHPHRVSHNSDTLVPKQNISSEKRSVNRLPKDESDSMQGGQRSVGLDMYAVAEKYGAIKLGMEPHVEGESDSTHDL